MKKNEVAEKHILSRQNKKIRYEKEKSKNRNEF